METPSLLAGQQKHSSGPAAKLAQHLQEAASEPVPWQATCHPHAQCCVWGDHLPYCLSSTVKMLGSDNDKLALLTEYVVRDVEPAIMTGIACCHLSGNCTPSADCI